MANKVDSYGTHFTDSNPHSGSGLPPTGTLVTVQTSRGPEPGRIENGRAVPTKKNSD
jgi:hypothetical protein